MASVNLKKILNRRKINHTNLSHKNEQNEKNMENDGNNICKFIIPNYYYYFY